MRIFSTIDEHFDYTAELVAKKPKGVFIATFGIYAGITYDGRDTTLWGDKFKLRTRDFLNSLTSVPNVSLMVGLGDYRSCRNKIPCKHCERSYFYQLIRLLNHSETFSTFKWKVIPQSHAKCTLFFYDNEIKGIIGGRNLNDSNYVDATFEVSAETSAQLYKNLLPTWKKAFDLNNDAIDKILVDQGINPETIKKIGEQFDE